MLCSNGHPVGSGARFCPECGAPISESTVAVEGAPGRRSRRRLLLASIAAVAVAGTAAGVAVAAGSSSGKAPDLSSVEAAPPSSPATTSAMTTVPSGVSFDAVVSRAQSQLRAGQIPGAPGLSDAALRCPHQVPVTPGSVFACTIATEQADPGAILVVTIESADGSISSLLIPPGSLCSTQLDAAQTSAVAALPGYTGCSTALPTVTFGSYTGVKPTKIFLSGDSSNIVTGITWSSWGEQGAVGTGTVDVEGCVPDCASGSQTPTATTIRLSVVANGQFTHLEEAIQGQPPYSESLPGVGQSAS